MSQSEGHLAVVAWVLGVTALALAILLRVVFQVPLPWPIPQAPRSVRIAEMAQPLELTGSAGELPVACAIVIRATALAGLCVGCVAIWRDRSYSLSGPAIALCCLALLWHYALVVVMMTIAVVASIMIVRMLLLAS